MGHVDYRAPRPLPRQFEVVDTVIFHDSESEFHGQTDSDRMSTLKFHAFVSTYQAVVCTG